MFVWLASYPKSGNTWLRLLLDSMHSGGAAVNLESTALNAPQASDRNLFDEALGLKSSDLTPVEVEVLRPRAFFLEAANAQKPLFRKVHDAWRYTKEGEELFPSTLTHTAIYMVRDPRDVAISLAHHMSVNIDDAIEMMSDTTFTLAPVAQGLSILLPQVLLSWDKHVESWLDRSGLSPLLLRYEDMLEDPVACCRAICSRLGWTLKEGVIDAAIEQTSFRRLADQEKRTGFSERGAPDRPFFRAGRAGGWLNILTTDQIRRIEKSQGLMMKRLGYH